MMQREILLSVLATVLGMPVLHAQNSAIETLNPVSTAPGGLRLQSVSAFTTYYSGSASGYYGSAPGASSGGLTGTGGSATLGYSIFGEVTGISITYSPSFSTDFQGYGANSFNHSLSFNWRRRLTQKWTFALSSAGVISSVNEAIFMPTALANVAGAPGSFGELSAAMVGGKFTNGPLAAILTGAPVVESPAGILLYGRRFLTATVQSGISYAHSSRLTFHVSVSASRTQALKDSNVPAGSQSGNLLAHTTSGSGSMGISYSLTPRTQLSADWSSSRAFSNLQDAYANSAGVSLGHTMSERWFLQVHAGTGFIVGLREYHALPTGPQYQAGGSVGYRRLAHTFLVSVDRSVSDSYGLGAGASLSATGAWNWTPLGSSSWSMNANFGQQWLMGTGFNSINSWRASAGLRRMVGRYLAVSTDYSYLSGLPLAFGPGSLRGQHMVRMSVTWLPNGQGAVGH